MNSRLKVVTVVGARPQFVKAAVVSRAIKSTTCCTEVMVHTGQHYDANMSATFFDELGIPAPAHQLGIGSGSHGTQTGRALIDLERVLAVERPDWVLVYGDTNSTLAAALAAAKLHQPVAHVEAGLRSFNRRMPEELNRIVTDHLSEILFTPTETATANLLREGVDQSKIHQVGDVMYDASKIFGHEASLRSRYPACLGLAAKEFVLATVHRAENTEDPVRLAAIFSALHQVSRDIPVVIPLHPRTRNALRNLESAQEPATQLIIIDPVGYLDMTQLERTAAVIATDSGGVQKEACFHGTPCVTLRTETEWVELVEAGCNKLCLSLDPGRIAEIILASRGSTWPTLQGYGDGTAANKIVEVLVNSRDR